ATRPTRRYSVRPRSELTRIGSRADTTVAVSSRRPANRRIIGATNSRKVKIAEVGKPGKMTIGIIRHGWSFSEPGRLSWLVAGARTAARHKGLPGLSATPWATMPGEPS